MISTKVHGFLDYSMADSVPFADCLNRNSDCPVKEKTLWKIFKNPCSWRADTGPFAIVDWNCTLSHFSFGIRKFFRRINGTFHFSLLYCRTPNRNDPGGSSGHFGIQEN